MKRLLFLTCLISTCLFSYGQIFSIGSQMGVSPMIKIHITINQDTVSSIKNIIVNIAASNETDTTQKILFDKPIHSLVGPWAIYATVFDTKNANGITMRDATSMLGSQIFTEDMVKDKYTSLSPKKSLNITYPLSKIVYVGHEFKDLPKGEYELQISYYKNKSNKVKFYLN